MDCNKMPSRAIKKMIDAGYYELTGILETGEVILCITTDIEKLFIDKLNSLQNKEEQSNYMTKVLKHFEDERNAQTYVQIYHQVCCSLNEKNVKNGLRIR